MKAKIRSLAGRLASQQDRIFAFVDQGLLGAGNMLAVIFFARLLPTREFAAYTLAVSVYYALFGFHRALIVMPFLLSGRENADPRRDAQWPWLALLVSSILFVVMALVTEGLGAFGADFAWLVAFFSTVQVPLMLVQEFGRRWLYQHDRGAGAATSSGLYLATVFAGAALIWLGWLPTMAACVIVGTGALLASILQFCWVRPAGGRPSLVAMGALLRPTMRFGLWQALTNIPYLFYNAGYPLLLGALQPYTVVAALSALRNLFAPANSLISAIDSTDKVRAMRAFRSQGVPGAHRSTTGTRKTLLLLGIPYVALVAALVLPLQHIFYGDRWHFEREAWLMAAYFALLFVNQPYETFLTTIQRGRMLFTARLVSCCVAFIATWLLVGYLHLTGAVLSLLAAQTVNCTLLAIFQRRAIRSHCDAA